MIHFTPKPGTSVLHGPPKGHPHLAMSLPDYSENVIYKPNTLLHIGPAAYTIFKNLSGLLASLFIEGFLPPMQSGGTGSFYWKTVRALEWLQAECTDLSPFFQFSLHTDFSLCFTTLALGACSWNEAFVLGFV